MMLSVKVTSLVLTRTPLEGCLRKGCSFFNRRLELEPAPYATGVMVGTDSSLNRNDAMPIQMCTHSEAHFT